MSGLITKSGPKVAHKKKKRPDYPKSDVRYWTQRVRRRRDSPFYTIRIQARGRRGRFNTEKPEKNLAGQKTKQIFDFIRANGWEDAIQKFKPAGEPQSDDPSFGEFFQAIRDHSTMEKSTLEIYIGKCRTLIGEIFKIPKPASVHYAKSEAKQKWTRKVEGIQIRRLKAQHVQRWKKRRIDMASTPAANQRARATINSILRNSKSLFSSRIQRLLDEVFPNFPWSNPITPNVISKK